MRSALPVCVTPKLFCKLDDFCFWHVHHHFSNVTLQNAHKNRKMEIQLVKIICSKKWSCRSWKNGTWENTGFATRLLDWFPKSALHILSPGRQRRNNVLRTSKSLQKRGFIRGQTGKSWKTFASCLCLKLRLPGLVVCQQDYAKIKWMDLLKMFALE